MLSFDAIPAGVRRLEDLPIVIQLYRLPVLATIR
jgi:hypothetical protein